MPPNCENCLIPLAFRCKPVKNTLGQCLKEVNRHVEPDITMPALKALVGGEGRPPILDNLNIPIDYPPSISYMLSTDKNFKFKVESWEEIHGDGNTTVGFLVHFKGGAELIFQP